MQYNNFCAGLFFVLSFFVVVCSCFLAEITWIYKNYIMGPNIQDDCKDILDLMMWMCTMKYLNDLYVSLWLVTVWMCLCWRVWFQQCLLNPLVCFVFSILMYSFSVAEQTVTGMLPYVESMCYICVDTIYIQFLVYI